MSVSVFKSSRAKAACTAGERCGEREVEVLSGEGHGVPTSRDNKRAISEGNDVLEKR